MALNLNKSEESPSNANGNSLIGNSSNAHASKKPEINCIASSKPDYSSAVISFTGKLPHICYHQVTSGYEVIDLDDTSSEEEESESESEDEEPEDEEPEDEELEVEEPDLDLSLKLGQGEVIDIKQEDVKEFSSSSVSSTDGQIQGFSNCEAEKILILLGCVSCHLFVMVSKDDPTCPMCRKKNSFIEIPSGKPFKKQKLE